MGRPVWEDPGLRETRQGLRENSAAATPLETWIRSHIAELAIDETGKPIDPQFTGFVEIMQPNGLVGEYLEVKRGKPNGAYREFFDDGTVRKVVFYKSGKASGDFWPDGQIKRKESKRGNQIIIEWFYPSGQLQKRYVKDKDYNVLEPVRCFTKMGNSRAGYHRKAGSARSMAEVLRRWVAATPSRIRR